MTDRCPHCGSADVADVANTEPSILRVCLTCGRTWLRTRKIRGTR